MTSECAPHKGNKAGCVPQKLVAIGGRTAKTTRARRHFSRGVRVPDRYDAGGPVSVLIAHLTDLHVQSAEDPVLTRAELIGRAIAGEVDAETKVVVLALGGDSAYSGKTFQFQNAARFYKAIKAKVEAERPTVEVQTVVVAGNHDCDFAWNASEERAAAAATAGAGAPVGALENFFEFEQSLGLKYQPHTAESPHFAWCDISVDDAILRIVLVNTSIASQLHEQPGSLSLPIDGLLPNLIPKAHYVLALLHHPWNWFKQPEVMRPLRNRIEELSDVILTGHEHAPETVALVRDNTISSLYVSGGVLQENGSPQESSFVILKLDLKARTRSSVILSLNESGFYERMKDSLLQPFDGNPARFGRPFELRPEFVKTLDDLGFVIHHARKQFLTLPDVFIYPDLLVVDEPTTGDTTRQVKSRDVPTTVLKTARVLISGGEKGGKTCLAKSLFRSAHNSGRLPVLLRGKDIQTRKAPSIRDNIRRAVREQYANLEPDQYEQTDRSNRVVIIDDFDLMVESSEVRTAIFKELEQAFSSVVLIGSETFCFDLLESDEKHESHLWAYTHYNILSFGELQREQFVRKWLSLAPDGQPVGDVRELTAHLTKLINGVIKRTLLPCYPLFLMIVLQQAESGQPTVRGGSYGHLFESVVTAILNRSRFTKISISAKHRYLATLAYELHQKNQASISLADAAVWHGAYWRAIGAPVEFDRLTDDFIELNILQRFGDRLSFR